MKKIILLAGIVVCLFSFVLFADKTIADKYVFSKDLKIGLEDEDVRKLQSVLNSDPDTAIIAPGALGKGTKGKETTYFGKATEDAVKKFQNKYKINPVSGFVGPITRLILNGLDILNKIAESADYTQDQQGTDTIPPEDSSSQTTSTYIFSRNLTLGSDNEDVRQLQIILNSDPDTTIVPPGPRGNGSRGRESTYFGVATKEAVQRFQKKYGILPNNGFVGPTTISVLNSIGKAGSFNLAETNLIDLRVNGDGTGDARTIISDLSTESKKEFTVSWLATSTLTSCKGLSFPTILNWNGDQKPLMGTQAIQIGNLAPTTTISLICNKQTGGEVTAQVKVDRTPAFNAGLYRATSSVSLNFFINEVSKTNYVGTSTSHFIFWDTARSNSCIGSSTPRVNGWYNSSKFSSGFEQIRLPVGTTTFSLKCTDSVGTSVTNTVVVDVKASDYVAPTADVSERDKLKIKSPIAGASVQRMVWTPILVEIGSGFSTSTRINVRLEGALGNTFLGQFSVGADRKPFNCGSAQSDTDRTLLCDAEGLKFRVLSGTLAGKYQLKFINVSNKDQYWFGPEFNVIKNTGITGLSSIEVSSPTLGTKIKEGTQQRISWTTSGVESNTVDINLLNSSGSVTTRIADNTQNIGSYTWNVDLPTDSPGSYRISVSAQSGTGETSGVSETFSIMSSSTASICTSFTYSGWSSCVDGQKTRTITTKSPEGCNGGNSVLNQSCTVPVEDRSQTKIINGNTYYLVWNDEFSGTTVDNAKWMIKNEPRRLWYWSPKSVSVSNGNLVLKAFKDGDKYLTGAVSSAERAEIVNGYFEARIKFAESRGHWFTYWIFSNSVWRDTPDGSSKDGVEVDIIEKPNLEGKFDMGFNWDGYTSVPGGKDETALAKFLTLPQIEEGYHVFGLLWTKNKYEFFVDGVSYWTVTGDMIGGISEYPQFVQLTDEILDEWAGDVTQAKLPDYTYVDYVRIYHRNQDALNLNVCTNSDWKKTYSACSPEGKQTVTSEKITNCLGGAYNPPQKTRDCTYTSTAQCTESNWTSVISPISCPTTGQQTKKWTKVGQCSGGVTHLTSETITCEYSPDTSTVNNTFGVNTESGLNSENLTVVANDLQISVPSAGADIMKRTLFNIRLRKISGFSSGRSMKVTLVKDSGERFDIGTFTFDGGIKNCLANSTNANLTCDGSALMQAKILAVVPIGTYKLKVIDMTGGERDAWVIYPINLVAYQASADSSTVNTASVSESSGGFWNYLKGLFR